MPTATVTASGTAHGDKDTLQDFIDAFNAGVAASGITPNFDFAWGEDDPDAISGLQTSVDGYGVVHILIPSFDQRGGCTYRLNHSDDNFSTSSTDQNVSPNDTVDLDYQLGRQWRVDIVMGDGFTILGEPTSPLA